MSLAIRRVCGGKFQCRYRFVIPYPWNRRRGTLRVAAAIERRESQNPPNDDDQQKHKPGTSTSTFS